MDNLGQIRSAVQSDLTVGAESTLFPPATINSAINRAYRKIGGLYRWSQTEDAKTTTTQANINYYDYPSTWRPNSIWKLMVGTQDYGDPVEFKEFLDEIEENMPSGKSYMWANQWIRYFLYPTPTVAGTTITIWGQKVVTELSADADQTIFTGSLPEVNEAIVLETVAILKSKGDQQQSGIMLSAQATSIVAGAWSQTKQNKAKQEHTISGWDVPDLFGSGANTKIGDFE